MSNLETKLDKIHHPTNNISSGCSKVEKPHKSYNLIKEKSNSISDSHHKLFCHYCSKRDTLLKNASLGDFWFLKAITNGYLKATFI